MRIETPYSVARRFIGQKEVPGQVANPHILAMLKLDDSWPQDDSVPWCSAFVNYVFWILGMERTKSLRARSWLTVGYPIPMDRAHTGFDVVILRRGTGRQPGPEVIDAPGHVGLYSGHTPPGPTSHASVSLLGGNQSDGVNIAAYPLDRVLGVRRILDSGEE